MFYDPERCSVEFASFRGQPVVNKKYPVSKLGSCRLRDSEEKENKRERAAEDGDAADAQ